MAREKATITIDRRKAAAARYLAGNRPLSEVIDTALDEYIRRQQLRRDVAAYARVWQTDDELALADLPIEFDLADAEVDYEALYGTES